jgi:protein-L-isoaspartate(D-aspartate) O-methyltransferase
MPDKLGKQLCEGGHLVCIHGRAPATKATLYRAVNGVLGGRMIFDAAAPLLPGFKTPPQFAF